MSGLGRVVRAGVARRRAAAVVTCLSTLAATAAAVAATALVIASSQPFDHAFATQHGVHLTASLDGGKAGIAQVAATAHASGVTASAGPFPEATATVQLEQNGGPGPILSSVALVGRADAGGALDDLSLISGHWLTGPGQIVLSTDIHDLGLGITAQFPGIPGAPTLTVVGYAQSVTRTADAWIEPGQVAALIPKGASPTYQMLYRFAQNSTDAQMLADQAAVSAMLPKGAVIGTSSYLAAQVSAARGIAPFVPFIVAFGVLALATAVLIITNVIAGAVGSALFKIGVLKALGAAPAQIVRAYCMIALVPSVVGVAIGAVVGNLIANPQLHNAQIAYGTGSLSVPVWTDAVIPLAALALVCLCAFVPALRAGRMSATAALAVGRSPRRGRGRFVRSLLAGLPISQPVGLGLGTPVTRPARYVSIIAALVFGTMALTFAVGLASSLNDIQQGLHASEDANVAVRETGGPGPVGPSPAGKGGASGNNLTAADAATVESAIAHQSGTASFYGVTGDNATVLGSTSSADVELYTGATTSPYQIIAGSWYTGPDQVLVPTGFLRTTGTHVGETVNLLDDNGERATVKIVGEVLDSLSDNGLNIIADVATFPGNTPDEFEIYLKPGVDAATYAQSLNSAIGGYGLGASPNQTGDDQTILAMDALAGALTLLVVATAGLGVFNTVMLELRDRIRELGVYKAVGMTPNQTVAMVLTSTVAVGLVAAAIGVPAGIALHDYVIPVMGHAAGTDIPPGDIAVYHGLEYVLLGLGGVAIAVLAALIPAGWAARLRTATALRTE